MSTKRRAGAEFRGKGPNGRNLCFCGCGREVERPRINWFSDACVSAWKLINDPATIRAAVMERDRGICASCGVDTELRQRIARDTRQLWMWLARAHAEELFWRNELPEPWPGAGRALYNCHALATRWVNEDMAREFGDYERHAWEADHIVPVIEGGGQCGLENYRTLCVPCHKRVTAELARRRAARRRAVNEQAAGILPLSLVTHPAGSAP
jgi:5-methylcytosine-specific restriction protein A